MTPEPRILLLVGPKGAGKSTLGRLLERTYGLAHVEPEAIWIRHAGARASYPDGSSFERAGFEKVALAVGEALARAPIVVTDTTAAADGARDFVDALARLAPVAILRLEASEATCAARIAGRDASAQLPADPALVARVHARSAAAQLGAHPEARLDVERTLPSPVLSLPAVFEALSSLGLEVRARPVELETARTLLRRWRPADRAPMAAMNAEPEVAAQLVAPLSRAESDALVDRIERGMRACGFGPWALEVPGALSLAGFCGLWVVGFEAHFTPAVEIVWRLRRAAWGHGYVTEAARAALAHAFDVLALPELVSFTATKNARSRAVMERLGMRRDPDGDFDHPRVPEGHPLRRHVLYRLRREEFRARGAAPPA